MMFDKMFKEYGTDPLFKEMIETFIENAILDVNNDLKLRKWDIEDNLVGAVLLMVISHDVGIEFLRTLNLVINGADEIAFGNVNEYLNKLEVIYLQAKDHRDKTLME